MAREPELSIKVKVDPVIDRDKFQNNVNNLIPESKPIKINGEIDAAKALQSVSEYQKGGQHPVPVIAKISNAQAAINEAFNNKTGTDINVKISAASQTIIKGQLQDIINGLDVSKISSAVPKPSTKKKTTTKTDGNPLPVSVTPDVTDESINTLRTKIQGGLTEIPITASISPEQLASIRKSVTDALANISFDPTVKKVNGATQSSSTKKKINIPSEDRLSELMSNAQYAATKSESEKAAAAKQKDIIYKNLVDHQAKAAENANAATAQAAQGLSDANKAMGDLNTAAVDFEQDWRRVVVLIATATKNLASLMKDSYGGSSGLDIFSSFQEFQKELPDLDTEHVKPYLKSIKGWADSLLASANGDFDSDTMIQAVHMLSGLADAWNQTDVAKLTDNQTKEKLLQNMSELNNIFPSSGNKEPFLGEKDAAINYLTDLLAKAAKYYTEVGAAAKQTADSIAIANQGFANQAAELKKNNAELEKLKQNDVNTVDGNTVDTSAIPGKIVLSPNDITPPETPVEIKGHVTLTDNDITVLESPIKLNGSVTIKNSEASKDETLTAKTKKKSRLRPVDSDDLKIQQEANKLLQQEEQEQQKIAEAAQKKTDAENKAFNREVAATQKKYDQAELDNLKEIESIYRELTSLEKRRGKYTSPDKAFDLNQAEEDIRMVEAELSEKMRAASETGYNPLKVKSIRKQALRYYRAQASSDNKFDIAKQNAEANAQKEANKALDEEAAERDKVAQAAQKQATATQKANEAAALSQQKQDEKNVGSVIDDIVSESNKLIRLYQQRSNLVKPEDVNALTELDDKITDIVDKIQALKDNAIASGVPINNFTEVANANTLVEKARINSSANFDKNKSAYNLAQATNAIEAAKTKYINAFTEIQKKREELAKTDDSATQQMIQNAIVAQKEIMKASGHEINSYSQQYGGLVDSAWADVDVVRNNKQIQDQIAYEAKTSKEAAATKKENIDLLNKYNQALSEEVKLYKDLRNASPVDQITKQNLLDNQREKVGALRKEIHDKGLNSSPEYQKYTSHYHENISGIDTAISNRSDAVRIKANNEADAEVLEKIISLYQELNKESTRRVALFKDEDIDELNETDEAIQRLTDDIEELEEAAQYSGIDLVGNDAYMKAFENSDKILSANSRQFNLNRSKYVERQTDALMEEYRTQIRRMQNAGEKRECATAANLPWKAKQHDAQYEEAEAALKALDDELQNRGLQLEQSYLDLLHEKAQAENVVNEAKKNRIKTDEESVQVTNKEIATLENYRAQLNGVLSRLKKSGAGESPTHKTAESDLKVLDDFYNRMQSQLNIDGSNKNQIAVEWANANGVENVKDYDSAIQALNISLKVYKRLAEDISTKNTLENSFIRASTRIANLKSELHDYLEKYPKIMQSELAGDVEKLQNDLDSPLAWVQDNKLGKDLAKIKQQAKDLGLEAQNLLDIFEKLFGQHLSTMITMAALHKMQEAAQQIYQNVVNIDTAMTELRKVTNLTASEYEAFMDRAADKATQLGIGISDFINSTADWARLGYTEQEAEELARVSSLMKNVGDGIESASDASSYLISALQGFGLAADQASEFLDVMNQIANTEPVTANDLGVIMQKSAAAMNAAGNTYQETMAMAAAVNGVLQDDDVSGTYLKTLSMYLRAAKTDAESAGIEIDGMADSVSELRSKLKSLTGVDIMSDAAGKNFKSTYQIMKELSQVWSSLSDVTQANVTELISGKRGGQATSALLNNFSVAEDAMEQAANATGSALAENAKYLDSIQGRIAQLDASFQSLSTHILDSGIVKYTVSFLTTIVKITDNITKLSGALPPIAAAVSGILSVMQANGKLQDGAGKANMPTYVRCA